jgi:hypothetical protein
MKRWLSYSLLGLLAFLTFLLLQAPATLATDLLARRLPDFSARAVIGLATDGSARGLRWRGVAIEKLAWRWRPQALARGWLEFTLDVDDPDVKLLGNVALDPQRRLRLRNTRGQLPLVTLSALAGQPHPPLQGIVEFSLRELRLNAAGQPQAADGTVVLLNAHATLGQPLHLGDFVAQLRTVEPNGIQGAIQDNGGPLVLDGMLNLAPDGGYRFNGRATVRDTDNQALRQALSLLGPADDDGYWTLSFSGVLAP